MPVYEFCCNDCHQKQSFFTRSVDSSIDAVCGRCGSKSMSRLISSFALHKSISDVWSQSGSPDNPGPDYYKDPRNIGRWVEDRFKRSGEELPSQISDMIQSAREGHLPEAVKDLQPGIKEV
ncbi:MAG: FmdB family zinc ribbon protein [Chloroflexota bacterium]|nr:FmdB family zinc ribbon protein [Chloroflexota bacterium]